MKEHFILAASWVIYCTLHSVLAGMGVKWKMKSWLKSNYRYYRLGYVIFSFAGLIFLVYYHLTLPPIIVFEPMKAVTIAGLVVLIPGLLLMLVCIKKYFMNLSGLRNLFFDHETDRLMTKGIHRYIRHPLYLGTFAFIWGLFLVLPQFSVLIVNTLITVYTLIGIYFEEKKLVAEFGEDYEEYRTKVPMLWPSWKIKK